MKDLSLPGIPWNRFRDFIALNTDRAALLGEVLGEAGLGYRIITVAGNRHFFVAPQEGSLQNRHVILTAHYDRAPGSPGANDNSAAVFILIEAAIKLSAEEEKNWLIIFTDKEELTQGEHIQNQGSYTLASWLKNSGAESPRIFNFDACGIGDSLIISTTAEYLMKNESGSRHETLAARIRELKERALEIARELHLNPVMLLPTPFSDDAGFLLAGVAAQTITVLPAAESSRLASVLRRDPDFAGALVNLERRNQRDPRLIPETWRVFNGPGDSHLRLNPHSFLMVKRFALGLCRG